MENWCNVSEEYAECSWYLSLCSPSGSISCPFLKDHKIWNLVYVLWETEHPHYTHRDQRHNNSYQYCSISIEFRNTSQDPFGPYSRHWLAWDRFEVGFLLLYFGTDPSIYSACLSSILSCWSRLKSHISNYLLALYKLEKTYSNVTQVHQTLQCSSFYM